MHHSSHGCYKYSLRWKGVAISKGKSACLWIALKTNFKCRVFQDKNRTIARRDNTTMKIAAFLADTPQILKRAMMTWPAFMENGNTKEIQQSTPPFPAKKSSLRAIQRINRYLHWSIWMHFSHARQSVLEAMLVQMLFLVDWAPTSWKLPEVSATALQSDKRLDVSFMTISASC